MYKYIYIYIYQGYDTPPRRPPALPSPWGPVVVDAVVVDIDKDTHVDNEGDKDIAYAKTLPLTKTQTSTTTKPILIDVAILA